MSLRKVLERGESFLARYPWHKKRWRLLSHATCLGMITSAKIAANLFYRPRVHDIHFLDEALARAKKEGRSLLTVMNHMSTVDDPGVWGILPARYYRNFDHIRWCLGAENVCFSSPGKARFFSLGKVISTKRFGAGPFQPAVDAAIRILSPGGTEKFTEVSSAFQKPQWMHVFPEGFVLQLEHPHSNSMRYFRWGVSRMVLEASKPPIILPIFAHGFEKVLPEVYDGGPGIPSLLPRNINAEIHVRMGPIVPDEEIAEYRKKWSDLVAQQGPIDDLNSELRHGAEAKTLRSEVASALRRHIQRMRDEKFGPEDPRFASQEYWSEFNRSEGKSDPEVKFIGKNWASHKEHFPEEH